MFLEQVQGAWVVNSGNRYRGQAPASSDFFAGIGASAARGAAVHDDFENSLLSIKSIRISGQRDSAERFLVDNNFSAASHGTVNLPDVDYSNDDESFGLFALDQDTGKEIRSISARDTVTGERWKWPLVSVGDEMDFEIQLI